MNNTCDNVLTLPKRDLSLDVIKIISCLLVVLMHTLRRYDQSVELHPFLYYLTRCSMPLFFMASGAVQLVKDQITYRYCFKKIWNIIKLMIFYYGFDILIRFLFKFDISIDGVIVALKGAYGDYAVFWFLRTLIMIYLILPGIHYVYKKYPLILILLLGIICIGLDAFNVWNVLYRGASSYIEAPINPQYRLWVWLFYYLLGGAVYHYLRENRVKGNTFNWVLAAVITSIIAVAYIYYVLFYKTNIVNGGFGYTSIFMMIWVITTMIAIEKIDFNKYLSIQSVIRVGSSTLLPMFALHAFVISLYDGVFFSSTYWSQILGYLIIVVTTFVFSYIITRIPILKPLYKI